MRRPLNWIVVAISLMTLFVNRMATDPVRPVTYSTDPSPSPGIFAYVQEDGTLLYLPGSEAPAAPLILFEDAHAASGFDHAADMPRGAVYTWKSPLATAERAVFQ